MNIKNIITSIMNANLFNKRAKIDVFKILSKDLGISELEVGYLVQSNGYNHKEDIGEMYRLTEEAVNKFEKRMEDKDFLKKLLAKNGVMLKYTNDKIRNDKDLVKIAMKSNPLSYVYLGEKYKMNKEYFWKAIKLASSRIGNKKTEKVSYIFEHSPFRDNEEIVSKVILEIGGEILEKTQNLNGNKKFLMKILSNSKRKYVFFNILKWVDDDLKNDDDIIELALTDSGNILSVPVEHPKYTEYLIRALKDYSVLLGLDYDRISKVDGLFKSILSHKYVKENINDIMLEINERFEEIYSGALINKQLEFYKEVIELTQSSHIFKNSPYFVRENKEIVKVAIDIDPLNLKYLSEKLLKDIDFLQNYQEIIISNKKELLYAYKAIEAFDRENKLRKELEEINVNRRIENRGKKKI